MKKLLALLLIISTLLVSACGVLPELGITTETQSNTVTETETATEGASSETETSESETSKSETTQAESSDSDTETDETEEQKTDVTESEATKPESSETEEGKTESSETEDPGHNETKDPDHDETQDPGHDETQKPDPEVTEDKTDGEHTESEDKDATVTETDAEESKAEPSETEKSDADTTDEKTDEEPTENKDTDSDIIDTEDTDSDIIDTEDTESETEPPKEDAACKKHEDADNNDLCDHCSISLIITVDFYAINDLHGKFADSDASVGVDELSTYLKNKKKTDDNAIFLSSGDMWQGSSESNLTRGNIITEWMNHMGFTSMTVGNHEYDWGGDAIAENAGLAQFPILAINIYDVDTNQRASYCKASVVVDLGEIQIAIIGAVGDVHSSIAPDKAADVYFKTGSELTNLVKAESNRLRAEGVDIIVYSLHDGYASNVNGVGEITQSQLASYYDLELSRGGYVDVVFEGHTHRHYALRDEYGVYHLQGGGDGDGISHLEFTVNFVTLDSHVSDVGYVASSAYAYLSDDKIVDDLMEQYKEEIAPGFEVLGKNVRYRSSDFLRELIAKLYLEKGRELWGDKYDIVLGGGFITARDPYSLSAGNVTYSTIQSIFPFDNNLVLCSITGSNLKSRFINSNNSNYFCAYDASFVSTIQNNKTYYIIVDSYSSTYGPNRLKPIATYDEPVYARDLLAEYIKNGGLEK